MKVLHYWIPLKKEMAKIRKRATFPKQMCVCVCVCLCVCVFV